MAKGDKKNGDSENPLARIEERLSAIELAVNGLRSALSTAEKIAAGIGLALILLTLTLGKSWMRETAREVTREEQAYRATIAQDGQFAPSKSSPDTLT